MPEWWVSAMLVKFQKTEIFQVGEGNITNQKILGNCGNAKMGWPRDY